HHLPTQQVQRRRLQGPGIHSSGHAGSIAHYVLFSELISKSVFFASLLPESGVRWYRAGHGHTNGQNKYTPLRISSFDFGH
ncbi:MAG: hypothetical protein ABIU05_04635, partial [Nitrospirales bacterium]